MKELIYHVLFKTTGLAPLYSCILLLLLSTITSRMFGEKFGHLGINVESVLSVMSRHPQYGCVVQIKEQLLADNGPVCYVLLSRLMHTPLAFNYM